MAPRDDEDFFNNISSDDLRGEPSGHTPLWEDDDTTSRWERDIGDLDEADWESHLGGPDRDPDDDDDDEDDEEESYDDEDDETGILELAARCVSLQSDIDALLDELDDAQDELLRCLAVGDVVECEGYRVIASLTSRYRYSAEVTRLSRELSKRRHEEIRDGRARLAFERETVRIRHLLSDVREPYPQAWKPWQPSDVSALTRGVESGTPIVDLSVLLGRPAKSIRLQIGKLNAHDAWVATHFCGDASPVEPTTVPPDYVDDDDIPF